MSRSDLAARAAPILAALRHLDPAARAAALDRHCGADADLRRAVEEALRALDSRTRTSEIENRPTSPTLTDAPPEEAGRVIGNYRVVQALGVGGFGVVYLAEQLAPVRRRVALKIIKPGMASPAVQGRFQVERHVLVALRHPNIAQLLDAGLTPEGRPFFAMEYVEGLRLDEYCDAQELSVRERLALFLKVCAGVQHAHQNLVIHRDIKPEHILVTPEGEPKLLDFGIAKLLNPEMHGEAPALPEGRLLTPAYASPEQVLGQPVTTASDIYSLGVVLYELLTGHTPYPAPSGDAREIIRHVTDHDPRAPSAVAVEDAPEHPARPDSASRAAGEIARRRGTRVVRLGRTLRGDLDHIVLMAMRKTPRRRYASVQQFTDDIQRYLDSRPVLARPPTWPYLASRFARRHRGAVAAAAVAVGVLLGAVGVVSWQAVRLRDANRARVALHEQTRAMISDYIHRLYEEVRLVQGAAAASHLLVETSVAVLEQMEAQAADNPGLKRDLAAGYRRVGEVQDLVQVESGERPSQRALDGFRRAAALYDELLAADPADDALRVEAARAETLLGKALALVVRSDEARAHYDAALRHVSLAEDRDAEGPLAAEAAAREAVGDLLRRQGDLDAAEEQYRLALTLRQRLRLSAADPVQALADEASNHLRRAGCHADREDFAAAEADAARALESLDAAARIQPHNVHRSRAVLVAHQTIGRARMNAGDLARARPELAAARDLAESLRRADARSRFTAELYTRALEDFADLEYLAGDFSAALEHAEAFRRAAQALADEDAPWAPARFALAMAHEKCGDALRRLAEPDRALAAYAAAEEGYAALRRDDQTHARADESWLRVRVSRAAVANDLNNSAEASMLTSGVIAAIDERGPDALTRPLRRVLLDALDQYGRAQAASDLYPEAIGAFERAIALAHKGECRVARWHYNVALLESALGEKDRADERIDRALAALDAGPACQAQDPGLRASLDALRSQLRSP